MIQSVGVYCASSDHIDRVYFYAAATLGRILAEREYTLLYGGGNVGLMGEMARAVHGHGGRVVGYIPRRLHGAVGIPYMRADELVVTETMQDRKRNIFSRADAFVVLPGGFGTMEEFMEVLTLKQLGYHNKPIALVNTERFFEPLLALADHFYRTRFAGKHTRRLYHVAPDPVDALDYIDAYEPEQVVSKWAGGEGAN